jgi:predicted metal-dependent phosphoesterase TrpH
MLQGVLHIHSTYSDGEFPLAELREIYLASGCRFACVTDHADAFASDPGRLDDYRRECDARSDDRFRFIAGLEYTCDDRMHVLGYGLTSLIDATAPERVIAAIRARGGLAVVAHPKDTAFAGIEQFDPLPDGIEVWNSKYDGRYAPRPATFALLARTRRRRSDVRAFYGQDLHWRQQYRGLFTLVDCDALERGSILASLGAGTFTGLKDGRRLPSDGVLEPALIAEFTRVHERSQRIRAWTRRVKGWIDGAGVGVPRPIKAQLRRIF